MTAPRDPYRYFRIEAHELLDAIGSDLMALGRDPNGTHLVDLLRHAHTLKGAARVVKLPEIARAAHELEDLFSAGAPTDEISTATGRGLAMVDRMRSLLERLDQPTSTAPLPPGALAEAPRATTTSAVRLELTAADELLEQVRRTGAGAARGRALTASAAEVLRRVGDRMEHLRRRGAFAADAGWTAIEEDLSGVEASLRALDAELDVQAREVADLHAAISEVRLVSLQGLGQELEQLAQAAAGALGKQVEVAIAGAETRVDAGVLAGLRVALRHVVQNAVAHGIEPEERRVEHGKPPLGRVSITFLAHGHRVHATCVDDGAGIDEAAVRRALQERGMPWPRDAQQGQLLDVLFSRGVSTARSIDEIAGRGLGLDVVAATVAQLRGEVQLESSFGSGTTVRIVVPISLISTPALALELDGRVVHVPLDAVARAVALTDEDVTATGEGERIVVDGEAVPFMPLARLLGHPSDSRRARSCTAVVLRSSRKSAALGVARVGGVRSIVVRNLPDRFEIAPVVAGAALNAEGAPELVISPLAAIEAVRAALPLLADDVRASRLPILVVDDSLTTRMLEKSILESAGYEVDVSVSAEQAIEMARRRRYGLFLVDVEMPGMDGFGFVAFARDDPELASVPAILVTSRADEEDKRRGKAAGARAYIVKGEFDQRLLLDTIGGLLA